MVVQNHLSHRQSVQKVQDAERQVISLLEARGKVHQDSHSLMELGSSGAKQTALSEVLGRAKLI